MAIGGLIGLLDDVAALAKLTASSLDDVSAAAGRATAKAAGVVSRLVPTQRAHSK
ncbi:MULTISPECIES: DUF808 family protein [Halomonadaceae]|jgi:predicted DNA repair protein MutK|uniref:DUF808 family protein n=1 Tax=Halomonadaceae TaxID=28256 RepID=UPI001C62DA87|nr:MULTISPECIES: DUF808 family protein [Halomonas]MCG7589251.1 DUF808 domain-containing protein [Halomonas sp. McD50-5]MCG7615412.1 DUF808 domain-containing protein [Halomonas sp. McD50-4]